MALPGNGDFRKRKPAVPLFKLTAMLMALLVLLNAVTGVLYKFHWLLKLGPSAQ